MTPRGALLLVAGSLGLAGCREHSPAPAPIDDRIAAAERRSDDYVASVDEVAARARGLTAEWADLKLRYTEIADVQARAAAASDLARANFGVATQESRRAAATALEADARWKLFRELVLVAAAIDAANLDASRAARGSVSAQCDDGMSTAAFRLLLARQGVALEGKDVDHIVPSSLGGADHPANYRLIGASENRSLGNTWDETKCASVGAERCARAVNVSRKCGSFHGPAF